MPVETKDVSAELSDAQDAVDDAAETLDETGGIFLAFLIVPGYEEDGRERVEYATNIAEDEVADRLEELAEFIRTGGGKPH